MKKLFYSLGIFFVIILLAVGWYFSGLIYETGLNPEFTDAENVGTAEDRVLIDSIAKDTIKLNVEEEQWGPLLENGIYGIVGQKIIYFMDLVPLTPRPARRGFVLKYYEGQPGKFSSKLVKSPLTQKMVCYRKNSYYIKF